MMIPLYYYLWYAQYYLTLCIGIIFFIQYFILNAQGTVGVSVKAGYTKIQEHDLTTSEKECLLE